MLSGDSNIAMPPRQCVYLPLAIASTRETRSRTAAPRRITGDSDYDRWSRPCDPRPLSCRLTRAHGRTCVLWCKCIRNPVIKRIAVHVLPTRSRNHVVHPMYQSVTWPLISDYWCCRRDVTCNARAARVFALARDRNDRAAECASCFLQYDSG